MIYLISDYSLGAHPKVMQALMESNLEHTDGYGLDRFSDECTELIRDWIRKPEADVHYFVGGTHKSSRLTSVQPIRSSSRTTR